MIDVGGHIPDVELYLDTPKHAIKIVKYLEGKKVLIIGVNGAFSPSCTELHLLGYIRKAPNIKLKLNLDEIICIAVNDPYVMAAWGRAEEATEHLTLLADTNAAFARATGLDMEIPTLGGVRSKRFSMIVQNGVVEKINVEPNGTGLTCTLADKICPQND